ncbi:IS21 family transposase [Propionimicrobium sp. PCR01-08-3]|uniref:IS21 family transposase n=1 Tax=Propionimicrobium sp. PCR01-08-3 TaxID=3052086 RepID=UPI00255C37BF|nr:IS21 family transposase [Propionimicrobium sp. PCR01-08-3]WIY84262.1 IS21 family transposase [Propionimicrobium sp. PCR01-08-3]
MEDWALIRRLAAEEVPHAAIARRLGISRTTVIKAVKSDGPPKYERRSAVTSFSAVEARVRGLLSDTPDMPATVLAERVGWTGSSSWFRDNVSRIRPEYQPRDPADRIVWEAGDAAQCDLWFPPRKIPLENGMASLLPVLVITLAYSRFVLGRMIPTKTTEDLLLGTWLLLQQLGRVPRRLIWDNERGIGRGRHRSEGVPAFMGTLATRLVLLPPRDPESKGVVERRNGWFETSFMPGRTFLSPADFNAQFTDWLATANTRMVRTIRARPHDRLETDKAAMLALPPVPPVVGWRSQVRLGRDYYVRIASNDYSVDPTAIGRMVAARADLDRVQVKLDDRLVAEHPRLWARGLTVTDTAHVETAARLRREFQQPRPRPTVDELVRDLADYDKAFGIDTQAGPR